MQFINLLQLFIYGFDLFRLSAAALFKQLPLETRVHWNKRLTVDVIVLVDWFGPGRLPGTAVHALEEIFTKV